VIAVTFIRLLVYRIIYDLLFYNNDKSLIAVAFVRPPLFTGLQDSPATNMLLLYTTWSKYGSVFLVVHNLVVGPSPSQCIISLFSQLPHGIVFAVCTILTGLMVLVLSVCIIVMVLMASVGVLICSRSSLPKAKTTLAVKLRPRLFQPFRQTLCYSILLYGIYLLDVTQLMWVNWSALKPHQFFFTPTNA